MAEKPVLHGARELRGNSLVLLVIGDVVAHADVSSLPVPIEVAA
jgi:hypothetical protein